MKLDLLNHIDNTVPKVLKRFDFPKLYEGKVLSVDKGIEEQLWNELTDRKIIQPYSLNSDELSEFESFDFSNNYEKVSKRLRKLGCGDERLLLIWNSEFNAVTTDLKTLTSNWEEFYQPSSDDLIIMQDTLEWIVYLSHFEVFMFGKIRNSL